MKGPLIAIGGAYIDINVPDFPLGAQGIALEQEVVGGTYHLDPGGSAVNFARLCAALGVPAVFIGKTGKDELGGMLADMLNAAGIQPALVQSADVATNISFNMANKRRTIMTVAGTANQTLTSDEVYARAAAFVRKGAYLYLGGCFKLKSLMPAFLRLAEAAKAAGAIIVLDHGRINNNVTGAEQATMRQLALRVDYYLPSADEFKALWRVKTIEEGLRLFAGQAAGTVVVKNGHKGAMALVDGTVQTMPPFPVTPVHTVGAGDSFNAGFVAARYDGQDFLSSLRFASAVAALKISRVQPPTRADVQNFLARQNAEV